MYSGPRRFAVRWETPGAPVIWRVPPWRRTGPNPGFVDPRLSGDYGAAVDGPSESILQDESCISPLGRRRTIRHLPSPARGPGRLLSCSCCTPTTSHPKLCTASAAQVTDPNGPLALLGCVGANTAGAGRNRFRRDWPALTSALLSVNQLSILGPNGDELLRFPDPQQKHAASKNPVNAPFKPDLSITSDGY